MPKRRRYINDSSTAGTSSPTNSSSEVSKGSSSTSSPATHSNTSTTTTATRTIIDGRAYHNLENVYYVLPGDDEDKDRLHQQHWMLTLAFGSNFDAPVTEMLEDGITVLDAGCGPGTWTLEMSHTYPRSQFYGIDIAPQFPVTIKPPNCDFQVASLAEKLPFPDNFFDYIHQRLLVVALTKDGWHNCLSELYRVLKPGGYVEFKEVDIKQCASGGGPVSQEFWGRLSEFIEKKGMLSGIPIDLQRHLLKDFGFDNVHSRMFPMTLLDGTKVGKLGWEDFVALFEGLRPLMGKTYEEYGTEELGAQFLKRYEQELLDPINKTREPTAKWYCIYAQKPAN